MSGLSRVTHRTIQEQSLANLQSNLAAMATLSEQLSTGKRINKPSDDPTGTVDALRLRTLQRDNEQYGKNANDGLAWLNATDTALQSTVSQLNVASQRVLQAMNATNQAPASRAALAAEIDGVLASVKGLANSTYSDRSLFSGTTTGDAVKATTRTTAGPDGTAGNADDTVVTDLGFTFAAGTTPGVTRQIGPNDAVRVDTDGGSVFGEDVRPVVAAGPPPVYASTRTSTSVFTLLSDISSAIKSGSDLSALHAQLQDRIDKITTAQVELGARQNRVIAAQDAVADRTLELTKQLSDVQDVDYPKAVIALTSQQTAYQAALQVTAKTLQTSLMDFIR